MANEPPEKPDDHSVDPFPEDEVKPTEEGSFSRLEGDSGRTSQSEVDALIPEMNSVTPDDEDTIEVPKSPAQEQGSSEPAGEAGMDGIIASIVGEQDEHSIEVSEDTVLPEERATPSENTEGAFPDSPESNKTDPEAPAEELSSDDRGSRLFSQESLDALLTQMNASIEAEESAGQNHEDATEGTALGDASGETEIGSLLAQVEQSLNENEKEDFFNEEVGDDVKSFVEESPSEKDAPSDIVPQSDDADQAAQSLSEEGLDTILAGEDSEQPLDKQSLDAVLTESGEDAAADMDAPLNNAPPDSDETPVPMPEDSEDSQTRDSGEAPFEDESEDDAGGQEVGSENLAAAGTVQEREGTDDAAQEAIDALLKKSARASAEIEAKDVKEAQPEVEVKAGTPPAGGRRRRRKVVMLPLPSLPWIRKAGISLAAGLIFGLATYIFLSNYQMQTPDLEVPAVEKTQGLEQIIQRAGTLVDTGDYAGAWRLLDEPVREAPPSPLRTQAEVMRIEAAYRSLGPEVRRFEAELVNSYIDAFLSHAQSHPACAEVLRWKADLYERVGLPYAAYDVCNRLLSEYETLPDKPALLLRMGRIGLEIERYEAAIEHLEQLVNNYPEAPQASEGKLVLGEALARLGKYEEGQALLQQVAEANTHTPLGAKAYTALARMAIDRGDYETAIKLLKRRLETGTTSEGNDAILLMLAESYRAMNQIQEAQDALRDIVRFFPESVSAPEAYLELTEILDMLGRRDDALRIASEAAQEHPQNPKVLLRYAEIRELTGDSRGAAEVLLNAEKAGSKEPEVLLTAGDQFVKAGYPRQAKEAFERLIVTFPGTPQAIAGSVALAKLLFEEGEVGHALSMLEDLAKVTENTPQETEVLLALGSIYQELGLQKRAGDVYRTVAAKSSEPEVLAQAAMALYATGAWSEGTEVARRVDVERLSESTAFGFLLDYAHAMLRADSKRALELMEQAYDDYPEQRTMHETGRLLETYLALDQFDKALALVDELAGQVQPANLETFRELATLCGDYAMNHQDYATAQAVYRKVIDAGDYETQLLEWAKLQLANALYAEGKTEECGSLLESVAASTSPWAADAQLRLDYIKLQGRLSGETRPVAGAEG